MMEDLGSHVGRAESEDGATHIHEQGKLLGNLRVGMLRNPANIISNGFMPGAVVQSLMHLLGFEGERMFANLEALRGLDWRKQGDVKTATLHYCDAMLMREHQSMSALLHISEDSLPSNVWSGFGETWLVISGELAFNVNGSEYQVGAGDLFIVPPGSSMAVAAKADSYALMISSELAERRLTRENVIAPKSPLRCNVGRWMALSVKSEAGIDELVDGTNWSSSGALEYAQAEDGAMLVRATARAPFSYEATEPTSLACVVLGGQLAFEGEVLNPGTLLHLPSDVRKFDFIVGEGSLVLFAGAPPSPVS
jgi:hypothetical protein